MPREWQAKVTDAGAKFVLSLQTGSPETRATFFPLDADQIDNAAAQIVTSAQRGLQLELKKSDPAAKAADLLRGIVVLAPDRAFEIVAAISSRP
jgi:hypothetical protein